MDTKSRFFRPGWYRARAVTLLNPHGSVWERTPISFASVAFLLASVFLVAQPAPAAAQHVCAEFYLCE